jgi:formylglycine-generating enzyme required for sulfatase activity
MSTFEITIQRKSGDFWPVIAELTRLGSSLPVRSEGHLRLDPRSLLRLAQPQDYGATLGQALFQGEMRDAFIRALSDARGQEPGHLNVQLFVEAQDLKGLHWEWLAAPLDGAWDLLAFHQETPFSQYLPSRTDRFFPPLRRQDARLLLLVAQPRNLEEYGLSTFDARATISSLRNALVDIPAAVLADREVGDHTGSPGIQGELAGDLAGEFAGPPTLDALSEQMTANPFTLLHVVCHGRYRSKDGETLLYLSDAKGDVGALTGSIFISQLGKLRSLPYFVFLSTCESAAPEAETGLGGLAQRLVRELGVPAALAMTNRISISTAGALAGAFYPRLRQHGEVDLALVEALAGLVGRYDANVPALFSRLRGERLFAPSQGEAAPNIAVQPFEPETVYIPGGSFWMGRAPGSGVPRYETPQHKVVLPAYRIGKYPVTNRQYTEFIRQTKRAVPPELGWPGQQPSQEKLNHPVTGVTWYEALAYSEWLSTQTNRRYSLPNEAQWEKAASGVDGRLYPWGDDWQPERSQQGKSETGEVDAWPAQDVYGVFDLVGNVQQWTCSLWGEKRFEPDPQYCYPWSEEGGTGVLGRNDLQAHRLVRRVVRGGSFNEASDDQLCALRRSSLPEDRGAPPCRFGFRVVMNL